MGTPHAIVIAGPTASGKSALAMALAERFHGVVINADSMQVYRELRILTARPSAADEMCVPHRLYGHVPAAEAYSAGRYIREVAPVIAAVQAEGLRPVIVGGTGLYLQALFQGLAPLPDIAPAVREHWRSEAERLGAAALHEILGVRDPEMAGRLEPADGQRIVRALEVLDSTGQSLAAWQALPGEPVLAAETTLRLVVAPPRAEIYRRVEARLDAMVAAGAFDEVRQLERSGLSPELPAMRAVGVPALLRAVRGKVSAEVAIETAKRDTRHYVKRQMTWLKHRKISWNWIIEQDSESVGRSASNLLSCHLDAGVRTR